MGCFSYIIGKCNGLTSCFPRLLLQGFKPVFPFLSLIIVEPMVSPDDDRPLAKLRAKLVDAAKRRVFEWQDRETAYLSLKSNPRTAKWDERVLRAFVVCTWVSVLGLGDY